MAILSIDFGLRRVGLAISVDSLVQLLDVVQNSPGLIKQLVVICQKNEIERIVIGLPEGEIAEKVKKFACQLKLAINLPVDFQDETLTSQKALDMMIKSGKKRKARQEKQDSFAAALILQRYLERRKDV
ncbi:MAG TPA: Holliday junction resolvase RuvX [Nevskiaceae bacterium]|nr:Holliday junction resolvase RuvX [Nevskiaceae bacterium]